MEEFVGGACASNARARPWRPDVVGRCELKDGMHVYGEPMPAGMIPFRLEVQGPPFRRQEESETT